MNKKQKFQKNKQKFQKKNFKPKKIFDNKAYFKIFGYG